jgi:hypothetical protein
MLRFIERHASRAVRNRGGASGSSSGALARTDARTSGSIGGAGGDTEADAAEALFGDEIGVENFDPVNAKDLGVTGTTAFGEMAGEPFGETVMRGSRLAIAGEES